MPVVIVNMLAGRSAKTKKVLLRKMTAAIASALAVAPESVRIILQEMPNENYGVAGLPIDQYRARKAAPAAEKRKRAGK